MRDWRYCPRCAHHPLIVSSEASAAHVRCPECGFLHYLNPIPTTIGIVRRGSLLLFLRRADEPMAGSWDAVGGFLEVGERAEECLLREAREELGRPARIERFLGTFPSAYGSPPRPTLGIAFLCTLEDGDADIVLSAENSEYGWFAPGEVPELAFADVRAATAAALTVGCGCG
jgi:NAD+ diphosphatase